MTNTNIQISESVSIWGWADTKFWDEATNSGYIYHAFVDRTTEADPASILGELDESRLVVCVQRNEKRMYWLYKYDDALIYVLNNELEWKVTIAAPTADISNAWVIKFLDVMPKVENVDPDTVPVRFWALGSHGPEVRTRRIDIHNWEDISGNYTPPVADKLAALMKTDLPDSGGSGKLLLLHGPPGTGKTTAIRALADAWRDWATVDYVVDPDRLFDKAAYMVHAFLNDEEEPITAERIRVLLESGGRFRGKPQPKRWRLLVIEDSGEFLIDGAQQRNGQATSRLLNLTDGLIGQGLRLLILMTTNLEFTKIDPAISRSGRCFADIAFEPFTALQARTWLQDRGLTPTLSADKQSFTLADLYQIAGDINQIKQRPEAFKVPGYA